MDTVNDDTHNKFYGKWEGQNKIVIGIDIGTTQSGVAYTYLQKGVDQSVHRVLSWPGQEDQNSYGKIPTLVWYNTENKAVSFGAEALTAETEEMAEDQRWQLAKYFKLHLHPPDLEAMHGLTIEPLPSNVPISKIYADFLKYLLQHTQKYFQERIWDGEKVWQNYSPTMEVVVAHPNGWGIREQEFLRRAVVAAGFTTEEQEVQKVHFVTEAEASVHFCMYWTKLRSHLETGINFAVCDAGGSTVDTTIYTVKNTEPLLQLEETCASACIQAGGIFVDEYAKKHLQRALSGDGLSSEEKIEYVNKGVKDFEKQAKRRFRDTISDQRIEIATVGVNKPAINVRRGHLVSKGVVIKSFFDPCVNKIISSIHSQLSSAGVSVPHIILVGGFGESPYLREKLKAEFSASGSQIIYTNEATSKAVADGALIWRCVCSVFGRAPRYSFGVESMTTLIPNSQEHRGRPVVRWPTATYVKGVWSQIVTKNIPIASDIVSRKPYYRQYGSVGSDMPNMNEIIYCHAFGGLPKWMRTKSGVLSAGFNQVCSVTANLSNLRSALQPATSPDGRQYWTLRFFICIRFGGTRLEAFVEWVKDGVKHQGPAKIIASSELV